MFVELSSRHPHKIRERNLLLARAIDAASVNADWVRTGLDLSADSIFAGGVGLSGDRPKAWLIANHEMGFAPAPGNLDDTGPHTLFFRAHYCQ